jgi:hypothetical protein
LNMRTNLTKKVLVNKLKFVQKMDKSEMKRLKLNEEKQQKVSEFVLRDQKKLNSARERIQSE